MHRYTVRTIKCFFDALLPADNGTCVLDLGCGTGLELEEYFRLNPDASVTGIDLSDAMLNALSSKFPNRKLSLIQGSYFRSSRNSGRCSRWWS